MADKRNEALQVDREAIAAFHVFASALNNDLDVKRSEVAGAIAYLTSEENISGGDTESFRESMETLSGILATVKTKVDIIEGTVGKLSAMLGDNASAKRATLKEARENMGKAIMLLKQTGK